MKSREKNGSPKPLHSHPVLRLAQGVVAAIFGIFLSGCQTLDFFLLSTPQETSSEVQNRPSVPPSEELETTIASVYEPDEVSAKSEQREEQPADLWIRMRLGFELREHRSSPRVDDASAWFFAKQAYIERVASRANPYLHYILTQLEQRNLPSELALIPIMESEFQPFARNPSGATGLWQFMPSTARRFGLKQNWWYDGRRDVVAASAAALDYLEYLHAEFDGDWLLAIAAYNAGEGTVRTAIRKRRQTDGEVDYWSLTLPRETKRYIPRLLALAGALDRPGDFNLELPPLRNREYFSIINLESQIDLGLVGDFAGISMDEVYLLNPAFNRWATDPDGPHRILIPFESREPFLAVLAKTPLKNLIAWDRHEVLEGQTLGEIAAIHHTSVASLEQANKLKDSLIVAGQNLIVPTPARPLSEYMLSATARGVVDAPTSGVKLIYEVKQGDSLWSIARRHDTRVKKLTAWNSIGSKSILRLGQKTGDLGTDKHGKSRFPDPPRRAGRQQQSTASLHCSTRGFAVEDLTPIWGQCGDPAAVEQHDRKGVTATGAATQSERWK